MKDAVITAKLLGNERVRSADTVLLYASFGSEVNTWDLAEKLLFKKKRVAFPRCRKDGAMTFHLVDDLSQLKDGEVGSFDICEPCPTLPRPELSRNTVCIVPGLAFTLRGERLGYGGGFYDRFLAENPDIFTVAAAYEDMLTESLPVLEHDIKINIIVTEERTVLCNDR